MPSGLCESGEVLPGLRWESPPGRLPHPGPSPNSAGTQLTEGSQSTCTALGWVWWEEEKLGLTRVLTCQETAQVSSPL